MNTKLERLWKEVAMLQLMYYPGICLDRLINNIKHEPGQSISWPRFEPDTSWIQVKSVTILSQLAQHLENQYLPKKSFICKVLMYNIWLYSVHRYNNEGAEHIQYTTVNLKIIYIMYLYSKRALYLDCAVSNDASANPSSFRRSNCVTRAILSNHTSKILLRTISWVSPNPWATFIITWITENIHELGIQYMKNG
jgi:hypothetical protein